jgi:hypothetical protein
MANNTLIIVGADKGGVGKTTVSRTLMDYFSAHNTQPRAFDTEFPKGTLKRFHPEETEVVDITKVYDQMKILDGVRSADRSTIIDVRAGLLSQTLHFFQDIGFLEALKRAEVRLVLFHVLGPSLSSLREIEDVAPYVTDAKYYLVKNFINDAAFFNWDQSIYDSYFPESRHEVEITIPKLNEMAYEQVESASIPFVSFISNQSIGRNEDFSFVLRGYVRHWLTNVWAQYDRINLHNDFVAQKANGRVVESAPRSASLPLSSLSM